MEGKLEGRSNALERIQWKTFNVRGHALKKTKKIAEVNKLFPFSSSGGEFTR